MKNNENIIGFRCIKRINAAEIVGVDQRMGSIDIGKDADLAIFSGHPFHTYSVCEKTFINGTLVWDILKQNH